MTIRRIPQDFVVEERLGAAFAAALRPEPETGRLHGVYELKKTSMTTPDAARQLAVALGQRAGAVDYAGLKDKHASTVQRVSLKARNPADACRWKRELGGSGWHATLTGWSSEPVTAGAIEGNRFTVIVRDLSRVQSDEMDRRAALLRVEETAGPALLVVNYFGAQRFGSARHGQGFAARHLVRGEYEQALKLLIGTPSRHDAGKQKQFIKAVAKGWGWWKDLAERLPRCPERAAVEVLARDGAAFREAFGALPYFTQTMSVEAYQSHLWNEVARGLVRGMAKEEALLRTEDEFGEMLFPAASSVGEAWRGRMVPVIGKSTEFAAPWGDVAARVLGGEGLKPNDLKLPGLRRPFFGAAERMFVVRAERFELAAREPDDMAQGRARIKRRVGFDLARGAYATVVLRALGQ